MLTLRCGLIDLAKWVLGGMAEGPGSEDDGPETASPLSELRRSANVIDLRKRPRTGAKRRGRSRGKRGIGAVTGICLHQTACVLSGASRFLGVPAHGGVTADADLVLLHPITAVVWHGHAANDFTIGIEISARADGVESDPRTFWLSKRERTRGKTRADLRVEATDAQLRVARVLVRYYVAEVDRQGGRIERIWAHRQAHRSRVSDPGSRIWQKVAIPLADELGLGCGRGGETLRTGARRGKPIPRLWDPKCDAPYSWRVK
jgi:hypothetical protein